MYQTQSYVRQPIKLSNFQQGFGETEEQLPMKRRYSNEEGKIRNGLL